MKLSVNLNDFTEMLLREKKWQNSTQAQQKVSQF